MVVTTARYDSGNKLSESGRGGSGNSNKGGGKSYISNGKGGVRVI